MLNVLFSCLNLHLNSTNEITRYNRLGKGAYRRRSVKGRSQVEQAIGSSEIVRMEEESEEDIDRDSNQENPQTVDPLVEPDPESTLYCRGLDLINYIARCGIA
jgi:hypothetical protein